MNSDSLTSLLMQLFSPDAQASQPLDAFRVTAALLLTFFLSLLILQIYRFTQKRSFVSQSFSASLILVSLVTAMIIMPISTNIVLSLGMVGALSIVRFRTALKDPIDIAFLFWSIAVGISNGAGFYNVSLVGTLMISLLMLGYGRMRFPHKRQYLVVVRYAPQAEAEIQNVLPNCRMLSQIRREQGVELTVEIEDAMAAHTLPASLMKLRGVFEASVVNYNGEHLPT